MNNSRFYKIGAGIGIALVVLIAIFIVNAKNRDKQMAKAEQEPSSIMSSTNLVEEDSNATDANSKQFNVIEEKSSNSNENSNVTEKKIEDTSNNKKQKSAQQSKNVSNTKKEEKKQEEVVKKDPTFKYPVKGDIMQDYAKDKLVYSATLGEWITHTGIDIKASKTTVVVASADGCVKSIKNDPRYGLTVVIEHTNGFSTVYSNLLTAEFVSVGENVKSGQTIGTVGNTAAFEILDEPHLHFEILKESEPVDPNMYLKN